MNEDTANDESPEESCWGMLDDLEGYGRHGDTKHDYKITSYEDSKTNYPDHMHAAHGMLYAINNDILWHLYNSKAAILVSFNPTFHINSS